MTIDSSFLIYQIGKDTAYVGVKQLDDQNRNINDIYCVSIKEKTAKLVFKSDYGISYLVDCNGTLYYIESRKDKDIYLSDWLCSYSLNNKKRSEVVEEAVGLCESNGNIFASVMEDGIYKIVGINRQKLVELKPLSYATLLAANKNYLYFEIVEKNEYKATYAYDLNTDKYKKICNYSGFAVSLAKNGLYIYQVGSGVSYYDFSTRKINAVKTEG